MRKILPVIFPLILFLFAAFPSFAQTPTSAPLPTPVAGVKSAYPLNTDSDVPQNFHTYSQNVFIEILTNISCMLGGYDPLNPSGKCLGINPTSHKIGYVESGGGAIGIVGNMIGMTFDIPVSSTTYVKDLASNFGITKTSLAALPSDPGGSSGNPSVGYGYVGLRPILDIWKVFRNLVYLVLVLIFIAIGLGIMFRVNVDARSVMSIQNQLPKIVIGILLVTFSYAIAGFIVDMMYVSMYLVYYVFSQQTLSLDVGNLNPSQLQGANPFTALGGLGGFGGASNIAFGAAKPFGNVIGSLFDNKFGQILSAAVGGIIGGIIPGVGLITGPLAAIGGWFAGSKIIGMVGGLIAYIIMLVAILIAMFRLWFLLLRSYIFFLVDVILAPFWIGLGLLPKGATAGFSSWLRDIVANLAVFPAALFILLLGKAIVSQFSSAATTRSFVPPLIGNPGNAGDFGALIGFGFILLLPSVVTMVRDTLKAPGLKYTQAIGQTLSVGTGAVRKPFSGFKNELFGKNQDGTPKIGSKYLGTKFGSLMSYATGGGLGIGKKEKEGSTEPLYKNLIKVPMPKMSKIKRVFGRRGGSPPSPAGGSGPHPAGPGVNPPPVNPAPIADGILHPEPNDEAVSPDTAAAEQALRNQAIEIVKERHNTEPAVDSDVFIENNREEIEEEFNRLKNESTQSK